MSDLTVMKGDHGWDIDGTLQNADGSVFNLTDYDLTFYAWEQGKSRHPFITGTATAVVATQGTWRYSVQAVDFLTAGDFLIVVRATKTGAQETSNLYTVTVEDVP